MWGVDCRMWGSKCEAHMWGVDCRMWGSKCEAHMWGVECEVPNVRLTCEVSNVRFQMWGSRMRCQMEDPNVRLTYEVSNVRIQMWGFKKTLIFNSRWTCFHCSVFLKSEQNTPMHVNYKVKVIPKTAVRVGLTIFIPNTLFTWPQNITVCTSFNGVARGRGSRPGRRWLRCAKGAPKVYITTRWTHGLQILVFCPGHQISSLRHWALIVVD